MREITEKFNVYTFTELNNSAKNLAVNRVTVEYIHSDQGYNLDSVADEWEHKLEKIGFIGAKVWFDCSYSQGSGSSFDCDYINLELILKDEFFEHYTEHQKNRLINLHNESLIVFSIQKNSYARSYNHSLTRFIDLEHELKAKIFGRLLEDLEAFRKLLCHKLYLDLKSSIEYYWEDENVIEYINERDIEFYETGKIYNVGN